MLLLAWTVAARAASFDALVADPLAVVLADEHTPAEFRVVALSFAAEVCAGRAAAGALPANEAKACLDHLAAAALDPRLTPWGRAPAAVADLGEDGMYLTHLAIVLGERDAVAPEACDRALHQRVVDHLVDRSLASAAGVARSHAGSAARWPADQAATLFALQLYDRAHATDLLAGPRERYLAGLAADGLPPSELTATDPRARLPRGSALAFTVRYLAPIEPVAARRLWERTVAAGFLVEVGPVLGVREWPPGVDGDEDVDSGPIVGGLGAAATALGRLAAQAVGDEPSAAALRRTAALGRALAGKGFPGLPGTANSALAAAITARAELGEERTP